MKIKYLKAVLGLILLTLGLLLIPGAEPGGAGMNLAEAQEGTPKGSPGVQAQQGAVGEPPEVAAQSWALVDAKSDRYLAGEDPDKQLPTGSVAKIMAALVVLEKGVDLDEEVTISKEAESYVGNVYSNVGLISGERVTVRDLLAASLIPSGTDAVYALAEHVGGGSVENFVSMMNEQASSMGLENTNFETPAGLDTSENYSSSRDLAAITYEALQYPVIAELVDTKDTEIRTQNREIQISNTNQLLSTYAPTTGVKTGTTPQAGANLIASAEANDESFISVVLGAESSEERFLDSEALLEYAFGHYQSRPLVSEGEVDEELALPYRRGEYVELAAAEDVTGVVDNTSDVERRVTTDELPPSAVADQELGEIEVLVDGQSVGSSPLVARDGYEEASWWDRIRYAAGSLLIWVRGLLS